MDVEARLAALEARLRAAEDHLAIVNLINAYGPLADSGSADEAAALWTPGGGYVFSDPAGGGDLRAEAPAEIAQMLGSPANLAMVHEGSAHLTATPVVTMAADEAEAIGYTFVIRRADDGWFVFRAAINRWHLRRTSAGWRIVERLNRTLDGGEASLAIMRGVIG